MAEIGSLLAGVQREIASLRESLSLPAISSGTALTGTMSSHRGSVQTSGSVAKLQEVLAKAEASLQSKAEEIVSAMMKNDVQTLPAIQSMPRLAVAPVTRPPPLLNTVGSSSWDVTAHQPSNTLTLAGASTLPSHPGSNGPPARVRMSKSMKALHTSERDVLASTALSQAASNTTSPASRPIGGRTQVGSRAKGKLTKPVGVLSHQQRYDPSEGAPITEDDVRRGVYSLVNRGLLPSSVDVTPAFLEGHPCVAQTALQLHDTEQRRLKPPTHIVPYAALPGVKLDTSVPNVNPTLSVTSGELSHSTLKGATAKLNKTGSTAHHNSEMQSTLMLEDDGGMHDDSLLAASSGHASAVDKIRGFNELLDEYSLHQFIIRKGKTLTDTPEFASFQRSFRSKWGAIEHVIESLELLSRDYTIPTLYIDGRKVADVAADDMLTANLTVDVLLSCIANVDQVTPYIVRAPMSLTRGMSTSKDALLRAAATRIQSVYRMYACHRAYKLRKHLVACADVIKSGWNAYRSFKSTRVALRRVYDNQQAEWEAMSSAFAQNWKSIKTMRRVEIHVPSLSCQPLVRQMLPNQKIKENLQLARLCAVEDPLVEVIYVSPFALTDAVSAYYSKMIEVSAGAEAASRFRVVVPENSNRLPPSISLASALLYSPRCLSRIRHYIKGKAAYLVPRIPGPEDKRLALLLRLPLLAGDPVALAPLYTKSGITRVLASADVATPPGATDIFDERELVATLADLIMNNLDTDRWLFKIDNAIEGVGTAYLDVFDFESVEELKERRRSMSEDEWIGVEFRRTTIASIMADLSRNIIKRVVVCRLDVYGNWDRYLSAFCVTGGCIQASPNRVIASPSAHVFIAPDGPISVPSCVDQLQHTPYIYSGCSFPCQSVSSDVLKSASLAIGQQLYSMGVIGYATIDFAAHPSPVDGSTVLTAIDVDVGLTNSHCMVRLFDFMELGEIDPQSGCYYGNTRTITPHPSAIGRTVGVPPLPLALDPSRRAEAIAERASLQLPSTESSLDLPGVSTEELSESSPKYAAEQQRSFVALEYIFTNNLSSLQFPAFFNMCRLKGVAFDTVHRTGSVALLVDSLAAGVLGFLCIDTTVNRAFNRTNSTLSFLGHHIGVACKRREFDHDSPNFEAVVTMIRGICRTLPVDDDESSTSSK